MFPSKDTSLPPTVSILTLTRRRPSTRSKHGRPSGDRPDTGWSGLVPQSRRTPTITAMTRSRREGRFPLTKHSPGPTGSCSTTSPLERRSSSRLWPATPTKRGSRTRWARSKGTSRERWTPLFLAIVTGNEKWPTVPLWSIGPTHMQTNARCMVLGRSNTFILARRPRIEPRPTSGQSQGHGNDRPPSVSAGDP